MTTKEALHQLIDELDDAELSAVEVYAAFVKSRRTAGDEWLAEIKGRLQPVDPLLKTFITAPQDDEPLTDEDKVAIEEGREAIRRGQTESWQKVRAELGLD